MFSNKMDFSSCAIWIDFYKPGHILIFKSKLHLTNIYGCTYVVDLALILIWQFQPPSPNLNYANSNCDHMYYKAICTQYCPVCQTRCLPICITFQFTKLHVCQIYYAYMWPNLPKPDIIMHFWRSRFLHQWVLYTVPKALFYSNISAVL